MFARRMAAVVVLVAVLPGCGSRHALPVTRLSEGSEGHLTGSRARTYGSLGELAGEAETVAVVRGTSHTRVEYIGTIPFTVTRLDVVEHLRGADAGPSVLLRQMGRIEQPVEGSVLVEPDRAYLVFLARWTGVPDAPTDQYVVVGAQAGLYVATSRDEFARTDELSPALPARLGRADVART